MLCPCNACVFNKQMTVQCPEECIPGEEITVSTPDGQDLTVNIPDGIDVGDVFEVAYLPGDYSNSEQVTSAAMAGISGCYTDGG